MNEFYINDTVIVQLESQAGWHDSIGVVVDIQMVLDYLSSPRQLVPQYEIELTNRVVGKHLFFKGRKLKLLKSGVNNVLVDWINSRT